MVRVCRCLFCFFFFVFVFILIQVPVNGLHGSSAEEEIKRCHLMSRWRWMKRRGLGREDDTRGLVESGLRSACSEAVSFQAFYFHKYQRVVPQVDVITKMENVYLKNNFLWLKNSYCMITGLPKHLASSRFKCPYWCSIERNHTHHQSPYERYFFITQHPCLVEVSVKCEGDLKAVIGNLVALTANSHFF